MNNDLRKEFPLLDEIQDAYLDNSATSQKPISVLEAEKNYYETCNANPMRGLYPLSIAATDAYENARTKVEKFLNAKSHEEIIFTRNATEALNLVAYSYGLNFITADDEIVVSIMEHHSNMLPWQMVAAKTGAKINYLMCEKDGTFSQEEMDKAFSEKTKLVAIAHVSNVFGRINPIEEVVRRAKVSNAVVVLDIAQSVPHMPIDLQALGVDFAALSGHKMYAAMGIGVLYGKKELLEKMPPFLRGGEMIESVTINGATYAPLPHKFEAGTVNVAGAVSLAAAIDFMENIGFAKMQQQEEMLVSKILDGMKDIPNIEIIGSQNTEDHLGIVTFVVKDVHPHDVSEILASDGINVRAGHHCAQPLLAHLGVRSATRVSLMSYNTQEEVEKFLTSLATIRRRMGYEQ